MYTIAGWCKILILYFCQNTCIVQTRYRRCVKKEKKKKRENSTRKLYAYFNDYVATRYLYVKTKKRRKKLFQKKKYKISLFL